MSTSPSSDPSPERSPDQPPTPESTEGPTTDRRKLLGKLIAMTALTAGLVKISGPARAEVGDPVPCLTPLGDGAFSKDNLCNTQGHPNDLDCGLPTGQGQKKHQDSDCGKATSTSDDNDCGRKSNSGGTHGYSDEDCGNTPTFSIDNDCGIAGAAGGGAHEDNNCTETSGTTDSDCGKGLLGGALSDNDCSATSSSGDTDCGMLLHADQDCSSTGNDNTNNPTPPDPPAPPRP